MIQKVPAAIRWSRNRAMSWFAETKVVVLELRPLQEAEADSNRAPLTVSVEGGAAHLDRARSDRGHGEDRRRRREVMGEEAPCTARLLRRRRGPPCRRRPAEARIWAVSRVGDTRTSSSEGCRSRAGLIGPWTSFRRAVEREAAPPAKAVPGLRAVARRRKGKRRSW